MLHKRFYKHLIPDLLVGLVLRLFLIWRFPFAAGDTPCYQELAVIGSATESMVFSQMDICIHPTCACPAIPTFWRLSMLSEAQGEMRLFFPCIGCAGGMDADVDVSLPRRLSLLVEVTR